MKNQKITSTEQVMMIEQAAVKAAKTAASSRRPRATLKDEVAGYIRELILAGEILPGSKIDLDGISDVMGVSKLPVREALIQLESEGLIESRTHRGSYVAMITPDDVRDHYHIFGMISGLAVSRAAATMTDERIAELEGICEAMENTDDPTLQQALNIEFHRLVNREGSSGRLLAVLRYLASSLPGRFYEFVPAWGHDANVHHREIVDLLRSRDGEAAGRAMSEHVRSGSEFAVKTLEERGYWPIPPE